MDYLRFGANLLKSKIENRKTPFQINIHVTDACNLRCRYCYIDFKNVHQDLPLSQLKKILREARSLGTERISLEGGEPLIRDDIGEIVDLTRDLGMECNINTNGYLLPRRINDIKRANMISLSLDGEKEVNDCMRQNGSFDKALSAIEIARENNIKVHVLSVLNQANKDSVDFMVRLAKELDFIWVPTSLFFAGGRKIDRREASSYAIDGDDYKKLVDELIEKKINGAPIVWSAKTLHYVREWPCSYLESNFFKLPDSTGKFKPVRCQAGQYFCVIQTNGDMYSCDPLLGYGKTTNCLNLGLGEAISQLDSSGCIACNSFVCTEYNYLFSLDISVILNLLTIYAKKQKR